MLVLALQVGLELLPKPAVASDKAMESLKSDLIRQLLDHREDISLSYTGDRKELSAKFAGLMKDAIAADDYVAYTVDSYLYTIRTWGTDAKIHINVRYRESASQTKQVKQAVGGILDTIVKPGMTQEEKVKAIHDWIVLHTAYDQSLQRYTAYDALTEGKAVCQGYALLAYRMLNEAGIETRIVEGRVDSGSHVWNLVRIGSKWHHMDVTWDDPVPDRPGKVSYAYFLKSDKEMKRDHQWTKSYPPAGG
jgi:transglutaminase/protease-like cytokinesis protein 3